MMMMMMMVMMMMMMMMVIMRKVIKVEDGEKGEHVAENEAEDDVVADMRWRVTMLRMMASRGRKMMMWKMIMWRRKKMMMSRMLRWRRGRTDPKTAATVSARLRSRKALGHLRRTICARIYRKNAAPQQLVACFVRACAFKIHRTTGKMPRPPGRDNRFGPCSRHALEPSYAEIYRKMPHPRTATQTLREPAQSKMHRDISCNLDKKGLPGPSHFPNEGLEKKGDAFCTEEP